jgi:predicted AlkP superfamily pyrophosphatase or phosphodiesterase
MKSLVIVCLDSFRFDYLKKTNFLKNFAKNNQYGKLQPIFGYRGIMASFLTGKYPQDHGVFTEFKHINNSFLKKYKKWKFLGCFSRLAINLHFNLFRFLKGQKLITKIPKIPFNQISFFDICQKKDFTQKNSLPVDNLFDLLRKKGIEFSYNEWPMYATNKKMKLDFFGNNDYSKIQKFFKRIKKGSVSWLHLWDLDTISHKYGIDSPEVVKKINELDEFCKKLVQTFPDFNFLFWSDHGMVPVKGKIDVEKQIKTKKFPIFLDSTMARFWAEDIEEIKKSLKNSPGKFLNKNDIKKLKINFKDDSYGKHIFLADPGYVIFPNYWNQNHPEKSMHGYLPSIPDQQGFYIFTNGKGKKDLEVTEIFPILSKFLKK